MVAAVVGAVGERLGVALVEGLSVDGLDEAAAGAAASVKGRPVLERFC